MSTIAKSPDAFRFGEATIIPNRRIAMLLWRHGNFADLLSRAKRQQDLELYTVELHGALARRRMLGVRL